ncbi:putative galacturan 1 4-alpha-galacturonidase SALK6 [Bienertia sinuspersici]
MQVKSYHRNLRELHSSADPAQFEGEDAWVKIERIDGLTVTAPKGAGVFDGQGKSPGQRTTALKLANAIPFLMFNFLTNSTINGITSLNSKLFHMAILGGKQLRIHNITVSAPENSVNTDGIHIGRSDGVNITDSHIGTGDDVFPLAGIPNEEPVQGVTVKGCTIKNTDNGVRTPSKVKLSDIRFQNVRGTSSSKEAVKVVCSSGVPCEKIQLIDIDLIYIGKDGLLSLPVKM